MCNVNPIILQTESLDNTLPQCPAGCGPMCFSSAGRRVYCLVCQFEIPLATDEARDLVEALAGLSDLHIDLFLAEILRRQLDPLAAELHTADRETDAAWSRLLAAQREMRAALSAFRASDRQAAAVLEQISTLLAYSTRLQGTPSVPDSRRAAAVLLAQLNKVGAALDAAVAA